MKLDDNIVKKRANRLKYTLMINKLNQSALGFYPNGISSSQVSKIINCKGEYLTEYQADKVIRILEKYKEDYPDRQFLIPRKEYLLGIDDYMTERDVIFLSRKDTINKYSNVHTALINMFNYSLSKKEIDTIVKPWSYDDYRNQGYDDEDIIEMYKETFEQSDCQEDDFPISFDTKTKKKIMFSQFQYYMKELEEFSDYLIWKILNLPKEKTNIKPFTMEHYE